MVKFVNCIKVDTETYFIIRIIIQTCKGFHIFLYSFIAKLHCFALIIFKCQDEVESKAISAIKVFEVKSIQASHLNEQKKSKRKITTPY